MSDPPFRVLPRITPLNEHFWRGGAKGELRVLRCRSCRHWAHPPSPLCPSCLGKELEAEAVSGRGQVYSYTVNHQCWIPGTDDAPYAVAIVELVEQSGLRLTTNIANCPPEQVRIGMPVRVVFEQRDDIYIPLFEPESD